MCMHCMDTYYKLIYVVAKFDRNDGACHCMVTDAPCNVQTNANPSLISNFEHSRSCMHSTYVCRQNKQKTRSAFESFTRSVFLLDQAGASAHLGRTRSWIKLARPPILAGPCQTNLQFACLIAWHVGVLKCPQLCATTATKS